MCMCMCMCMRMCMCMCIEAQTTPCYGSTNNTMIWMTDYEAAIPVGRLWSIGVVHWTPIGECIWTYVSVVAIRAIHITCKRWIAVNVNACQKMLLHFVWTYSYDSVHVTLQCMAWMARWPVDPLTRWWNACVACNPLMKNVTFHELYAFAYMSSRSCTFAFMLSRV